MEIPLARLVLRKNGIQLGTLLNLTSALFFGCSDEGSATIFDVGSEAARLWEKMYTSGNVFSHLSKFEG